MPVEPRETLTMGMSQLTENDHYQADVTAQKETFKLGKGGGFKASAKEDEEPDFVPETPCQYLLIVPDRYKDYRSVVSSLEDVIEGDSVNIKARVLKRFWYKESKQVSEPKYANRLFCVAQAENGSTFTFTAFGKVGFTWKACVEDAELLLHGEKKLDPRGQATLANPEILAPAKVGKIESVMPKLGRTSGKVYKKKIEENWNDTSINQASQLIEGQLGATGWDSLVQSKTGFSCAKDLIVQMHMPSSVAEGRTAKEAARFLSAYSAIKSAQSVESEMKPVPKSMWAIPRDRLNALAKLLGHPLTKCQIKAILGIKEKIESPIPMRGVLCGDVGTGKTLTFVFPSIISAELGKQVAILVPNTILAEQICDEIKALAQGIKVTLVTGNGVVGPHDLSSGGIAVGTTALPSAVARGNIKLEPDLLITDEQHRFSVGQRESLLLAHTNFLESTATPIPRTAALLIHAGRSVFRLETCPVKKTIDSKVVSGKSKSDLLVHLGNKVRRGEKVAVIYPLVEESEHIDAKSIEEAKEKWAVVVGEKRIGILHGRMTNDEKTEVIKAFKAGDFNLLLSSTVIEVGVTIPGLDTLTVVNAERMGVVGLHQLRGRLARKGGHGEFYMTSGDNAGAASLARLDLVVKYTNGFDLAEADANIRGFGDLLGGTEQKGKTRFMFQGVSLMPHDIAEVQDALESAVFAPQKAIEI